MRIEPYHQPLMVKVGSIITTDGSDAVPGLIVGHVLVSEGEADATTLLRMLQGLERGPEVSDGEE